MHLRAPPPANSPMPPTESFDEKALMEIWRKSTKNPQRITVAGNREEIPQPIILLEKTLNTLAEKDKLILPNLDKASSIVIFSDYGGETGNSNYNIYSFLICDYKQLGFFSDQQDIIRARHKLNNPLKEISYKSIDYGPTSRALDDYLCNLNNSVHGIILTVLIEKGEYSLWGNDRGKFKSELPQTLLNANLGNWDKNVAEKLVTITHLVAYLIALFCNSKQKIMWISDEDALFANNEKTTNTGKLLTNVLKLYTEEKMNLYFSKSFGKENTTLLDLLSAPDLAAGCIDHYYIQENKNPFVIKNEANKVLIWLSYHGILLKKHCLLLRKGDSRNSVAHGHLQFNPIAAPENAKIITVPPSRDHILKKLAFKPFDNEPIEHQTTIFHQSHRTPKHRHHQP